MYVGSFSTKPWVEADILECRGEADAICVLVDIQYNVVCVCTCTCMVL